MSVNAALPRNRRLKLTAARRTLARETFLAPEHLAFPMSVDARIETSVELEKMPGVYRYSIDGAVERAKELVDLGVPAVYVIGIPTRKDAQGSDAWAEDGVVSTVTRRIKEAVGDNIAVIGDSYLGYFTDHQIGGVLDEQGRIMDEATLEVVQKVAVAWAKAGVDIFCCSTMVDGRVAAARSALDAAGLTDMILMSSIKFNSEFYKAGTGATATGGSYGYDKSVFYIDPANAADAMRIVRADIAQGAEMINVKPATPYQDVVRRMREEFDVPVSAFSISGDYSMIHYGAKCAGLDERGCALELITSLRRAGADMVINYWAPDAARWLRDVRV